MERRLLRRFALGAALAALALTASASSATASVTIGQLAPDLGPGMPPLTACGADSDSVIPEVASGNSYVFPGAGVITSWSHNAAAGDLQMLGLKVLRHLGGAEFLVVAQNGPRALAAGSLNTFPVNIPVLAGDILALNTGPPGAPATACEFDGPNYELNDVAGPYAVGQVGIFSTFGGGPFYAINISAVFEFSNAITRNKKKGTATLTVDAPNPGELTGSGKGVKVAGAAVISKPVLAPGEVKLTIKAKGKKKATLKKTGKVTVKPNITYTPTGGDPGTQVVKVKLKKKL